MPEKGKEQRSGEGGRRGGRGIKVERERERERVKERNAERWKGRTVEKEGENTCRVIQGEI